MVRILAWINAIRCTDAWPTTKERTTLFNFYQKSEWKSCNRCRRYRDESSWSGQNIYPSKQSAAATRWVRIVDSYSKRVIILCLHDGQTIIDGFGPTCGTLCTCTICTAKTKQKHENNGKFKRLNSKFEMNLTILPGCWPIPGDTTIGGCCWCCGYVVYGGGCGYAEDEEAISCLHYFFPIFENMTQTSLRFTANWLNYVWNFRRKSFDCFVLFRINFFPSTLSSTPEWITCNIDFTLCTYTIVDSRVPVWLIVLRMCAKIRR